MSTYIVNHDNGAVKVQHVKRSLVGDRVSYCFPNGNKKYKGNDETGFIIWSIPPVSTCPFSTEQCRKNCYAVKAWRAYPTVRVARTANKESAAYPRIQQFIDDVTAIIKYLANTGKNKKRSRIIVRVHESGDYFAEWYFDAWVQIARNCADDTRIVFWSYTKSFEFLIGKQMPENFRVRASVWADTDQAQLDLIEQLNLPIYTAVEKFADNDGYAHCRCEDCATCETPCGDMTIRKTACEIH